LTSLHRFTLPRQAGCVTLVPAACAVFSAFAILALLIPVIARCQQANVNLDWDPHRNADDLTPFSAPLNSPEVHDDRTVTFRVRAPEVESVELNGAILAALDRD
jgi:hypothetical protein